MLWLTLSSYFDLILQLVSNIKPPSLESYTLKHFARGHCQCTFLFTILSDEGVRASVTEKWEGLVALVEAPPIFLQGT